MRAKGWLRLIGCGFGLLVLLAAAPAASAADIVFQDGLFHEFDGTCDNLTVRNNFWDEPTSVEMVSPAEVKHYAYVYDTSELAVLSGSIGIHLYAFDSSQVTVSGGSIGSTFAATDSSQVTVSGGSIVRLNASGSSQVTVSGGSISDYLHAFGSSQVTVSGGSMDYLKVFDSSQVTVSGGTIGGTMEIYSTLTVVGSDFSISGVPVPLGTYTRPGEPDPAYGTLSGTLAMGETFTNNIEIHDDGKLILTPEPATLSLLALGGLLLIVRRRRCA